MKPSSEQKLPIWAIYTSNPIYIVENTLIESDVKPFWSNLFDVDRLSWTIESSENMDIRLRWVSITNVTIWNHCCDR